VREDGEHVLVGKAVVATRRTESIAFPPGARQGLTSAEAFLTNGAAACRSLSPFRKRMCVEYTKRNLGSGKWRAERGEAGVDVQVASERHGGRSDAEHRNEVVLELWCRAG
jgi:hypothetical protein